MSQIEVQKIFHKVAKSLSGHSWFKKGNWRVSSHLFPFKKPEFVTFHVYKDHWFNESREGIHIETFLAFEPKDRKKSSITIHLLHYDLVPGTKLKRRKVAEPIVDRIYDEVSSWDGYKFRTGKYGLQPFTKNLDGNSTDFPAVLVEEVARICKYVGPIVDEVLAEMKISSKK